MTANRLWGGLAVTLFLVAGADIVTGQPGNAPFSAWYANGVLLVNRYLGRINQDCDTPGCATYDSATNKVTLHFAAGATGATGAAGSNGANGATGATGPTVHSITFSLSGGGAALSTGACNVFPTSQTFSGTINRIDISADRSGSVTLDIWKANAAIPNSGNKISASAPITLSSAQLNQNGSTSGWNTAVSSGDVWGCTVVTASTVQNVTAVIWFQ